MFINKFYEEVLFYTPIIPNSLCFTLVIFKESDWLIETLVISIDTLVIIKKFRK